MRSGLSTGLIRELGPLLPGQTGGPVLNYEITGEMTGQEVTLKVAVDGQEISTYYDPMLAKLIAWGPDRPASLRRMELALSNFPVLGLVTNIPFLREVIRHPHFQQGLYDTNFLENTPAITQSRGSEETRQLANALAAWATASHDFTRPGKTAESREPVHDSPWRAAGPRQFP